MVSAGRRWRVRLELCPVIDGGRIPPPAVWTVRDPAGVAKFVTSNPLWARLTAHARSQNRPDPLYEDVPGDGLTRVMVCAVCDQAYMVALGTPPRMPAHSIAAGRECPGVGALPRQMWLTSW
jgi:hypothetical protein